jgi:hypothetical protein
MNRVGDRFEQSFWQLPVQVTGNQQTVNSHSENLRFLFSRQGSESGIVPIVRPIAEAVPEDDQWTSTFPADRAGSIW